MSGQSSIQWTDRVWNPVVGCTKVSQGCKHCYAKTLHDMRHKAFKAGKLQNIPQYAAPFETVQLIYDRLGDPLGWRKPSRVFVNSMSDLFHEDVPDEFILSVFQTMAAAPQHAFQILTKRPARMLDWFNVYLPDACSGEQPAETWPLPNVWLGVSAENQAAADERIPLLLQTPAVVRFLSCEPLLGPLSFRWARWDNHEPHPRRVRYLPPVERGGKLLAGSVDHLDGARMVDWIIVGGESGKGARPFDLSWARTLVGECREAGVPVFVKQLGAVPVQRENGVVVWPEFDLHDRHGGDMAEWPEDLRVREFPRVGASALGEDHS